MNRRIPTLAIVLALLMALTIPLGAAELHEAHVGTDCSDGQTGVWHFVNNQTEGAAAGTLMVSFDQGGTTATVGAAKTLRNTQHFYVEGGNTIDWARTNLPGKLVLSDFECEDDKK